MACCAAAIFIILNMVYAARRLFMRLTGKVERAVVVASPAVNWSFVAASPVMAAGGGGDRPSAFMRAGLTRRHSSRVAMPVGLPITLMIALSLTAFWFLTKPDAPPTALSQIEVMQQLHARICGPATTEDQP